MKIDLIQMPFYNYQITIINAKFIYEMTYYTDTEYIFTDT